MYHELSCWIIPILYKENTPYFLIVQHQWWKHRGFPKWHLEMWEQYIMTAKREFQEETWIKNILIYDDIMFEEQYIIEKNNRKLNKKVIYFIGIIFEDFVKNICLCNKELQDYKICDFNECVATITREQSKDIVKQAYNELRKI